ncbi:MAG TPA: hypothetical protein VKS99_02300 [Blastocatellia bacterium]|nr:hypothetical protein [Blastocatellia bacterium]
MNNTKAGQLWPGFAVASALKPLLVSAQPYAFTALAKQSRAPRPGFLCETTCKLSNSAPIEAFNTGTAFAIIVS